MITKAFENAYKIKEERNWDTLYIMVDIHQTILHNDYSNIASTFYEEAIPALQMLSARKELVLILWSSCFAEDMDQYFTMFQDKGIEFSSFNTNPDVENTEKGCFDLKPYFNVVIDDKAGFDPKTDWDLIVKWYETL